LERAEKFYEKYGGKAIIIARWVPVVRTFVPFVAGMARCLPAPSLRITLSERSSGSSRCCYVGYWFGQRQWIKDHFSIVTLVIIVISCIPVAIEIIKYRMEQKNKFTVPSSRFTRLRIWLATGNC